jgi:hypothetical protein
VGYFPNGTSGCMYEEKWCENCLHGQGELGNDCAVWLIHQMFNYDECNNQESPLHILIPRDKEGFSKKCAMFHKIQKDAYG